jgi:EpsI family protein
MLMLAYQQQQFQEDRVHSPELCYYAQGFIISDPKPIQLRDNELTIQAKFFSGSSISRNESVIYWIRTGNTISENSLSSRSEIFASGIKGKIDDGILVRVSMVESPGTSPNSAAQIATMSSFLQRLLAVSPPDSRLALLGRHGR